MQNQCQHYLTVLANFSHYEYSRGFGYPQTPMFPKGPLPTAEGCFMGYCKTAMQTVSSEKSIWPKFEGLHMTL